MKEAKIAGQKAEKKPTAAQLERRINNAILILDKTKDTVSVYFDDKGVRITVNNAYAIVETSSHKHVFDAVTVGGYSQPYLFLKKVVEIWQENDELSLDDKMETRSYARLVSGLNDKGMKDEHGILWLVDKWMFNLTMPLYEIGSDNLTSFGCYENFVHNVARNAVLLGEHKEDLTNKQFFAEVIEQMQAVINEMSEFVVIHKETDEERISAEMESLAQDETEKAIDANMEK